MINEVFILIIWKTVWFRKVTETHSCCSACKTAWILTHCHNVTHCDTMVSDICLHSRAWQLEPVSRRLSLSTPASSKHRWASRVKHSGSVLPSWGLPSWGLSIVTLIRFLCGHKIPATTGICAYKRKTLCRFQSMGWVVLGVMSHYSVLCSYSGIHGFLHISSKLALALLMGSCTVLLTVQWNSLSYLPAFSKAGVTLKWGTG